MRSGLLNERLTVMRTIKDGYWYSLLDSLYEDLVHSLKYHPVVDIGDLATKEYVDKKVAEVSNRKFL